MTKKSLKEFLYLDVRILNQYPQGQNNSGNGEEELFDEFYQEKLEQLMRWTRSELFDKKAKVIVFTNASATAIQLRKDFKFNWKVQSDAELVVKSDEKTEENKLAQQSPAKILQTEITNLVAKETSQEVIAVHFSMPLDVMQSADARIQARKKVSTQLQVHVPSIQKRLTMYSYCYTHIFLIPDKSRKFYEDFVRVASFISFKALQSSDELLDTQKQFAEFDYTDKDVRNAIASSDRPVVCVKRLGIYDEEDVSLMKSFNMKLLLQNLEFSSATVIGVKKESNDQESSVDDDEQNPFI